MTEAFDTGRPHPARVYDYLLGGKDNFAADRAAAQQGVAANPNAVTAPRQNRAFLQRTVRWLASRRDVKQFLDIGTGLPTRPNVHEVAQGIDPAARVVYADNDPIVLAHARALLTGRAEGRTDYVEADLRDPKSILAAPELRATLDFDQPVGLLLYAVLHFIEDDQDPYGIVKELMDALPAGSYLVVSHITADHDPESWGRFAEIMRGQGIPTRLRSRDEVGRFFDGLELVEPGVVPILQWRPDQEVPFTDTQVALYGGVARKP
ncbi:SAM-dependent methyltransferase [Paractinoplanes lichenicola]|uniref:SAM-dependent methyltransferase n=1 Tax=Paractinoplanes lichenicola TaxID=2802976 RepID=A0ABS1VVY3_9ACTN|nr:SAM-dependent methyltransferase [Actinoplanes lichenicola]MBL7258647.1 SAM-dependent methyltransferase [Actinoplanes lichenicola]